MDGVLEPAQPVAAGDENVGDATVAQVVDHAAPEPGALAGHRPLGRFGDPDAQDVLVAIGVNADRDVGRLVLHHMVVADLDHQGVQEHHRVDGVVSNTGCELAGRAVG